MTTQSPDDRPLPLERIDLQGADDPRDVIHRTVACLAQGGVVILPTETCYVLAASALHPEAVGRFPEAVRSAGPALLLRSNEELVDYVPDLPAIARQLFRRGAGRGLTLRLDVNAERSLLDRLPEAVRARLLGRGRVDLQGTQLPFLREILHLMPAPLVVQVPVGPQGVEPVSGDDLIQDGRSPAIDADMLLDAGTTPLSGPATVAAVGHDEPGWTIEQPGVMAQDEVARMSGRMLLFVCTGNTCRSPMAEALCKVLLARRVGCDPKDLPARGFVVGSAGVAASTGMPAASHAIEIVRQRGGSLEKHQSQKATANLVLQADVIVAMTRDHLDVILENLPETASRARLLHPEGQDVPDPIGGDRDVYLRAAKAIEGYLDTLLDELGWA